MEKCVFLDKDGTLVQDVPYNIDIKKISYYKDIFEPLLALGKAGYKLIIISNQAGLAKGLFNETALHQAFSHIRSSLAKRDIYIADYYFCPHDNPGTSSTEIAGCHCRKPQPGLLIQAAEEHDIDLSQSWMIGDILADVGAGRAANCRSILVDRTKRERMLPQIKASAFIPDYIVDDFSVVDAIILHKQNTDSYEYACEKHHQRV